MSVVLRYFYKNTHVPFTENKLRYSGQVIFSLWFSHHMEVYLSENANVYLISPNLIFRVYVPACSAKSR